MDGTINVAVPAELLPLLRKLADDQRSWSERLRHDWGGRAGSDAGRAAAEAGAMANDCFALVQAIDAATEAAR